MRHQISTIKALSIMLFILVIASCSDNLSPRIESGNQQSKPTSHAISQEKAIADLLEFISEGKASRSDASPRISSIIPVKYAKLYGVSRATSNDCENLVYIANFENNGGYAVLAADDRIDASVLALIDTGNFNDSTTHFQDLPLDSERPFFPGYPTSGPGFYTDPKYPGETFINPNTVDLYDAEHDDTLVGNFKSVFEGEELDTTAISIGLCFRYANSQITKPYPFQRGGFEDRPIDGFDDNSSFTIRDDGAWETTDHVYNILSAYRNWHQHNPLNKYSPVCRAIFKPWLTRNAFVGCVPLSLGKIMKHLSYPNPSRIKSNLPTWDSISMDSSLKQDYLAQFLRTIGAECYSCYFYEGTFTLPVLAEYYLSRLGYKNVRSVSYDFNTIISMIKDNVPVIIYALPGLDITSSHCWIIDGYRIKERKITYKTYANGVLKSTREITESKRMVHCDFGWGGVSNGYYFSNVFRLQDKSVELDGYGKIDEDLNYNNFIHIITLFKP